MRQKTAPSWPYLALAGVGLAAIPLAAAARRRRRAVDPNSAPGYTARRSFGDYTVVGRSVTIARPRAELFAFWRGFRNLPRFMANLEAVEPSGEESGHATWHIRAPGGRVYAVDTRIAREVDGDLIAWRSTEGSEIDTEGRVTLEDAPGDRGTRVSLIIAYKPNFRTSDVREALMEMSGGIGVDAVIDAVGMEAHGFAFDNMLDIAKQTIGIGADRASALKQAILAVRPGGRVSVPGVYGGITDKFPLGALMEKGLQLRTGQTHVQRYMKALLGMIEEGKLDTTFLISHRLPLEQAAEGYRQFRNQQDSWTKVVLKPGG